MAHAVVDGKHDLAKNIKLINKFKCCKVVYFRLTRSRYYRKMLLKKMSYSNASPKRPKYKMVILL